MHRALLATESPTLYFAPPPPIHSPDTNADNKISPSIFLIIIILAIIFFIAGLFHLLVRCLHRPPARESEEGDNATDLQGQLQQLFHLHDSGVDQSFIDTLPVFLYKAIIGLKSPFDCAVCLCEFEQDDKLRLLPRCSHAFHLECIDTWLLSHSTCPLCRGNLLPDFSPNNNLNLSPVVLVLESGSESSREIVIDREADVSNTTQLDVVGEEETGSSSSSTELSQRSSRTAERAETSPGDAEIKVVAVKLGKFRNVDGLSTAEGFSSNSSNVDARRCYSMGSFEYVLDNSSLLQVAIRPSAKKQMNRKTALHMKPGHRPAMSECGCLSVRGLDGFEEINLDNGNGGCAKIGTVKRESYSVSKIWLRGKKEKDSTGGSIRRSVSFKLPFMIEADASKCTTNTSRRIIERCLNHGHLDDEGKTSNSMDLQTNPPPYERMSLHWLLYGRQQKEDHSTPMSHV